MQPALDRAGCGIGGDRGSEYGARRNKDASEGNCAASGEKTGTIKAIHLCKFIVPVSPANIED
jgi:hypothetical protein